MTTPTSTTVKPTDFPDQPRSAFASPPTTIANVAFLLDQAGIGARYNSVKKRVEVTVPDLVPTAENADNVTMAYVTSLCASNGISTGRVAEYVTAIADQHVFNPVADWIRSRPWDGEDRVQEVLDTIIVQPDYPKTLQRTLMHKWLRSAAAAAIMPDYKGRGVLTFQGAQGLGKTSWVKSLVSDPQLAKSVVKLDHHMDSSNKDSILGAISHWIVEMGEVESSLKKDLARLKGFITSDSDRIRRPYDRRESEYPRRTLFVATVNDPAFLVDSTGNSRWWTIAVKYIRHSHGIDMQQVFAQMATEVEAGEKWWLDHLEEAELAEWNKRHAASSVVADSVYAWLDLDQDEPPVWMTPSEVLKAVGLQHPNNAQAKECGAILRTEYGSPHRINGRDKWKVSFQTPTTQDLGVKAPTPYPSKKSLNDMSEEVF